MMDAQTTRVCGATTKAWSYGHLKYLVSLIIHEFTYQIVI